jgi:hypothetical protein
MERPHPLLGLGNLVDPMSLIYILVTFERSTITDYRREAIGDLVEIL